MRTNDNEQYMRHGHPLSDRPKEDCKKEVISISHTNLNSLKFITENDIDAAHHIGRSRNGKPPAIIVRFFKRDIISKILATRRNLKHTGYVITEYLTASNQKLLNRARSHNDINTAWSWNGSIWCVTKAGHKINLRLYEDINKCIRNASRQHHQHQDRHIGLPTSTSAETTSVPVNTTTTPAMSTTTTLPVLTASVGVPQVLNDNSDNMGTTSTASSMTAAVKRDFPDHFLINGEEITDANNIANKFCEYFTNIGPSFAKHINMPKNIKVEDFFPSTRNCTFQFYKTDDSSILKIIYEFPNKTSTGFDDLCMRLIKLIKSEIIPSLTCIFNQLESYSNLQKKIIEQHIKLSSHLTTSINI